MDACGFVSGVALRPMRRTGRRCATSTWRAGTRMTLYGEEFKEFETKGNTKLQDRLVQEVMYDIHKIVLADHIDFYVSSEIVKLRESLREMFQESRKKIHEKGDMVARLEAANVLYKWDKLVRDAELQNKAAAKELEKENAALDALINRPQRLRSLKIKSKAIPPRAPQPRLVLANVSLSLLATYLITAGFIRSVETSIHENGMASIAQLGFLLLTVMLVFTSSLSMTLPRK
mmetsp:Transcript_8030/g.24184  ORF Transcript_8030/g.24184 Transcript_8030/m.24184 type:complete len:232 (-) Transcript_8030:212-907(-)